MVGNLILFIYVRFVSKMRDVLDVLLSVYLNIKFDYLILNKEIFEIILDLFFFRIVMGIYNYQDGRI